MKKFGLFFFTAFLFLFLVVNSAYCLELVSVSSETVNLRTGPGTNYKIKWEYGKGFPLVVLSKNGDWYKVKDFENDTGWIYKNLVSKKGYMIVKVFKNKNKKINIRSGPSVKNSIVGHAYYGVVFETLEQKEGWARVRHESGLTGWVKRDLLWGF